MKAWVRVSFRLAVCAVLLGLIASAFLLGVLCVPQLYVDRDRFFETEAVAGGCCISRDGCDFGFISVQGATFAGCESWGSLCLRHTGFDSAVAIEAIPGGHRVLVGSQECESPFPLQWPLKFGIVNLETLKVTSSFTAVPGPPAFCYAPPNRIVAPAWSEPPASPNDPAPTSLQIWTILGESVEGPTKVFVPWVAPFASTRSPPQREGCFSFAEVCCPSEERYRCRQGHRRALVLPAPWSVTRLSNSGRSLRKTLPRRSLLTTLRKGDFCAKPTTISRVTAGLVLSPHDKYSVIWGGSPAMIEVRSLPTLKLTGSFRFDDGMVSAAAVSDDGRYVALGYLSLKLWDSTTGKIETLDRLNEDLVMSKRFRDFGCKSDERRPPARAIPVWHFTPFFYRGRLPCKQ